LLTGLIFSGTIANIYNTASLSLKEMIGSISEGTTQSRSEFEVPRMIELIRETPLLGTGMKTEYFTQYGKETEIGVADVPLLGHIAMYGFIGFSIFLIRYYKIHKAIRTFLKGKETNKRFLIWAISEFYASILFKFFNFSGELHEPGSYLFFGIMIGVIFGLFNKIQNTAK
jgi:hypothetical protein